MYNYKEFTEKKEMLQSIINKSNLPDLDKQLIEIDHTLAKPEIWSNPTEAANLNKRRQEITSLITKLTTLSNQAEFISEFSEVVVTTEDESELNQQFVEFVERMDTLEVETYLNKPEDKLNAIMSINAGSGGTESANWVKIIARMYSRFAEANNFGCEILDEEEHSEDPNNCISSITIKFSGVNAYGLLKNESGVHRFIRNSPYSSSDKRHTSCIAVDVVPEVNNDIKIEIKPSDLNIIARTAGGNGGQGMQRTKSACWVTHIPSGIHVLSRTQREFKQNKENAIELIRSKLYQIELDKINKKEQDRIDCQMDNSFGSQVRNYTMSPFQLVKDLRSGYESSDIKSILDGNIMLIIKSLIIK